MEKPKNMSEKTWQKFKEKFDGVDLNNHRYEFQF